MSELIFVSIGSSLDKIYLLTRLLRRRTCGRGWGGVGGGQGCWDSLNKYKICQGHRVKVACWVKTSRRDTMQGLKVLATIATIVDEIARVDAKFIRHWSVKYRSRSPGQGACLVRVSRRNTMQGLKVLPTVVDEIARVNGIVDVRTDGRKMGRLCRTMPAAVIVIQIVNYNKSNFLEDFFCL